MLSVNFEISNFLHIFKTHSQLMFKKIFNDLMNSKFTMSFIVGLLMVLLYHFVVFPGLTVANTIINIGSAVFGVMLLMFGYFFIKHHYFNGEDFELFTPDPDKEPETELDYNPNPNPTKRKRKPRKKHVNSNLKNKQTNN